MLSLQQNNKNEMDGYREVTREVLKEGPPGIHGVIIEVDL
jgi:hypothetical protein